MLALLRAAMADDSLTHFMFLPESCFPVNQLFLCPVVFRPARFDGICMFGCFFIVPGAPPAPSSRHHDVPFLPSARSFAWGHAGNHRAPLGRAAWVGGDGVADSDPVFPPRSEREIQPHLSAQDAVGAEKGGGVVCGGGGGRSAGAGRWHANALTNRGVYGTMLTRSPVTVVP